MTNEAKWRFRVAAAYRWTFERGQPMPPGLDIRSQRVRSLVLEYEANSAYAEQDRERDAARARIIGDGKNPDGTPTLEAIAYVELCSRQVAANMKTFFERNAPAPTPTPAEALGVKATERPITQADIDEILQSRLGKPP